MTIKDLLRKNIYELRREVGLNITYYFKDDKIYIKNDKKLIYEEKLSNIGLDFDSQKEFILNIIKKCVTYLELYNEIDWNKRELPITIDNYYYFDVLNDDFYGDAYKNYFIELPFNYYNDKELKKLFKVINDKLYSSDIRVIYYHNGSYKEGFYVSDCKYKIDLKVFYIDKNLSYKNLSLYISYTKKEEIEKAVKFIKELVA